MSINKLTATSEKATLAKKQNKKNVKFMVLQSSHQPHIGNNLNTSSKYPKIPKTVLNSY